MFRVSALLIPILVLSSLVGCSVRQEDAQAGSDAELPAFEFKQFTASTTLEQAMADGAVEECSEEPNEETFCRISDARVGKAESDPSLTWAYFKKRAIDWFSIEVRRDQYGTARTSLISAYGEPCKVGVRELQNAFGANFESEVTSWCFSDGTLKLAERSARNMNFADLTFQTHRETEPASDFDPNEL